MRTQTRRASLWLLALAVAVGGVGCSDPVGTLTPAVELSDVDSTASAAARDGKRAPEEPPPAWGEPPSDPGVPPGPFTPEQLAAAERALVQECHAWSLYLVVMQQLGDAIPFSNIAPAEQRHMESLSALFVKRGLPVPPCPYAPDPVEVPGFAGLREACDFALLEEQALLTLYDTLLQQSLPPDATTVFTNLRDATGTRHIPAFETCSTS